MKATRVSLLAGCMLSLTLTACASAPGTTGTRRDPDLITAEEARASNYSSAYELVRSTRPNWFRTRGSQSSGGTIAVYLDSVRLGGPDSLRSIPINAVGSIRYFSPTEATQRWGTGHAFGAIQVESQ